MERFAIDFGRKRDKYPLVFFASKRAAEKYINTMIGIYDVDWPKGTQYEKEYNKQVELYKNAIIVKYKITAA